jgi:hypothetical protein
MTTAVQEERKTITFYHWIDRYPSSEKIHVSGGESRIASNGEKIQNAEIRVDFHNGMFSTDDPSLIEFLRRKIAGGDTITEDREAYYSHVLKPEEQVRRQAALNRKLTEDLEEAKKETGRLRAQLEAKGGKKTE